VDAQARYDAIANDLAGRGVQAGKMRIFRGRG
jgi:hypothetical protein